MLTLGIETTGRCGGIALWRDESLVAKLAVASRETHSRRLVPSIMWLMESAGVEMEELDCVAVSLGPGSFTGIRIGLSTARGLSLALGIELSGVPTLDVLAHQLPPLEATLLCPVIDARNYRFYTAIYRAGGAASRWERISEYRISTANELALDVQKLFASGVLSSGHNSDRDRSYSVLFTGDALYTSMDEIKRAFGSCQHHFAPEWLRFPCPSVVAALSGRYLVPTEKHRTISPLYVKLSQAEEYRQQGK